ncbi:MAG: hypothetical protein EAX86_04780 [Candidatus Heimdallarchaeota archaeon]|nr:hypothetical protein [Candidatus Heimdallarchaeota archaeon]
MVSPYSKAYLLALLEALFVTILWSSSWVIIKFTLEEISPLIFASFRYLLASSILMLIVLSNSESRNAIRTQNRHWWKYISLYGIIFIAGTQGTQFLALDLLPAITVSFLLNLTPFVVILISIPTIREVPSKFDIIFFFTVFIGIFFYFSTKNILVTDFLGIFIAIVGVLTNALSSILGRKINRDTSLQPIVITGISMTIGSFFLVILAFLIEGLTFMETISPLAIIAIIWLGIVNTAFAFTLWNKAMKHIRAMDISLINSTMLPQIVLLSIVFLEEHPTMFEWLGLGLIVFSVAFIQWNQTRNNNNKR